MEVPTTNLVPEAKPGEQIDPKYLAMAAAQMHSEGRLFESEALTKGPRIADADPPMLRDLKPGEHGNNPAELYNAYRKSGASEEDARKGVIRSLKAGNPNMDVEKYLRSSPMS